MRKRLLPTACICLAALVFSIVPISEAQTAPCARPTVVTFATGVTPVSVSFNGGSFGPASNTSNINWTATVPGATSFVGDGNAPANSFAGTFRFRVSFTLPDAASGFSLSGSAAGDNVVTGVEVNGTNVATLNAGFTAAQPFSSTNPDPYLMGAVNNIDVILTSSGGPWGALFAITLTYCGCPTGDPVAGDIVGTSGDDNIVGTAGADVIWGLGGNDKITSMGGNDQVSGGGGIDKITGMDGDDFLCGNGDSDDLTGGAGDDSLGGGGADDRVTGGDGNDNLYGGAGADTIAGGSPSPTVSPGTGDLIDGGNGSDVCTSPNKAGQERFKNC